MHTPPTISVLCEWFRWDNINILTVHAGVLTILETSSARNISEWLRLLYLEGINGLRMVSESECISLSDKREDAAEAIDEFKDGDSYNVSYVSEDVPELNDPLAFSKWVDDASKSPSNSRYDHEGCPGPQGKAEILCRWEVSIEALVHVS